MLDHVSIPVRDLDRAARFYDVVLAALGLRRRRERTGAIGYGPDDRPAPVFWLLARGDPGEVPVRAFTRLAVEDYDADGTTIPAGDRVLILHHIEVGEPTIALNNVLRGYRSFPATFR